MGSLMLEIAEGQEAMAQMLSELRLRTDYGDFRIPGGSDAWRAFHSAKERKDGRPDRRTAVGRKLYAWERREITNCKDSNYKVDGGF
jgi:hypothetical protein